MGPQKPQNDLKKAPRFVGTETLLHIMTTDSMLYIALNIESFLSTAKHLKFLVDKNTTCENYFKPSFQPFVSPLPPVMTLH